MPAWMRGRLYRSWPRSLPPPLTRSSTRSSVRTTCRWGARSIDCAGARSRSQKSKSMRSGSVRMRAVAEYPGAHAEEVQGDVREDRVVEVVRQLRVVERAHVGAERRGQRRPHGAGDGRAYVVRTAGERRRIDTVTGEEMRL